MLTAKPLESLDEASLEIAAKVMRLVGVPINILNEFINSARHETQPSARKQTVPRRAFCDAAELYDLKIENFLLKKGNHAEGKTLAELNLRSITGASVFTLRRGDKLVDHPDPDMKLKAGDMIFMVGSGQNMEKAISLLEHGKSIEPGA